MKSTSAITLMSKLNKIKLPTESAGRRRPTTEEKVAPMQGQRLSPRPEDNSSYLLPGRRWYYV